MEVLGEEAMDDLADVGRHEALAVHLDVLAVLQRRDDGRVGRGPADAVLLERLDERGLRIARRRLGEVLLGGEGGEAHSIADLHRRQHVIGIVGLHVVGAFLVHRDVARLHERRAVGAEQMSLLPIGSGERVHGDRVEQRVTHLRGDRALPDERIEAVQVLLDLALDVGGRDGGGGRADGLVGLLCILRLGLVDARFLGDLGRAVEPRGHRADLVHRFRRERHRVGAHVGDETDAALADVLSLVELLRETHGAAGVEAELAGRLLLERRGGEGRGRVAPALLAVDRNDPQLPAPVAPRAGRCAQRPLDLARLSLAREAELLDLLAAILDQLEREALRAVRALTLEGPVLPRHERGDLLLALADHAQRRALYPARGESPAHFLPQQRREIEADQVVERAARLLRVHELERQAARLADRLADGVARDLVEHHAVHVLAVEVAALGQDLLQVPGDGLPFAIGVRGQIQRFRLAQIFRDALDVALVLVEHLVLHREALVRVDRALLGHEIADVPVGGEHLEVAAQIFLDGLGLGGRLDYDQVVCHDVEKNARAL